MSRYLHLNLGQLKICETFCEMNTGKICKISKFPNSHFRWSLYLECFGGISRKFFKSADAIYSLEVNVFLPESRENESNES